MLMLRGVARICEYAVTGVVSFNGWGSGATDFPAVQSVNISAIEYGQTYSVSVGNRT